MRPWKRRRGRVAIAEQVAAELDPGLGKPDHEALSVSPTENLQAYDFYLGSNILINAGIPEAVSSAKQMYVQATS